MNTVASTLTIDPNPLRARFTRPAFIKALILAAVLLTFAPICRHGFLAWDDDYTIQGNPRIMQPSLTNLAWHWRHEFMDLYVPVTYTIWAGIARVSQAIWGELDPRLFHAASVAAHATNALLVFGLLRRLLKRSWPAAGGALLFALHPVQIEPVAWMSGLKDLLAGTFSLIALTQYLRAVGPNDMPEAVAPSRRRVHYVLGMAAMLLGMLCKPSAMVTPLLAGVTDLLMMRRPWRAVIKSLWPWLLLAVPCIVWTKLCQPPGFLRITPLWQRPLIATDALAFYLYKLVIPLNLTFDYGRTPWVAIERGWAYWTWVLPVAVAVTLFAFRKRAAPLIAAWLLLVVGVAPVLGLTVFDFQMISTVADHYLYMAMLGPALAAAWALSRCPTDTRRPAVAAAVVLGLLAARAADQSRYWNDTETFFTRSLKLNPASWPSTYGLGFLNHLVGRELAVAATLEAEKGQDSFVDRTAANLALEKALAYYQQTVRLNPNNVAARHGAAGVAMYFGRYQEAAEGFNEVLKRRNTLPPGARERFYGDADLLGQCQYQLGRFADAERAFRFALKLNPEMPDVPAHLKAAQSALASNRQPQPLGPALTGTQREGAQSAAGNGN